jgi:hypothetical protein
MALIVRYGSMRYLANTEIAIIGAGDYSERQGFYDKIKSINRGYYKKDFFDPKDRRSGAIIISNIMSDSEIPPRYFAQLAEFKIRSMKGNPVDNAKCLEKRLKSRFKDSAKRHLCVMKDNEVIELKPDMRFFDGYIERAKEVSAYLNGSLEEVIRLGKE